MAFIKRIRESTIEWLITGLLFLALPFVYDRSLMDAEMAVRLCWLSFGLALIVAIATWQMAVVNRLLFKTPVFVILAALFAYRMISGFRAYDPSEAFFLMLRDGIFIVLYLLFVGIFRRSTSAPIILSRSICIGILIFITLSIGQFWPELHTAWQSGKPFVARSALASTLLNKNFFAETLVLLLPFAFYVLLQRARIWRIVSASAVVFATVAIWLLQSDAVWLALVVEAVIVVFYVLQKKFSTSRVISITAAFVAVILVAYLLTDSFQKNLQKAAYALNVVRSPETVKASEKSTYNSFTERLLIWQHTWRMIKEEPLFGVGTANWKTVLPRYGVYGISFMDSGKLRLEHPHNEYLLALAEGGLVELLLFIALIAVAIRQLYVWRLRIADGDKFWLCCLVALVGLIIICMFSFPLQRFYPVVVLMMVLAYASVPPSRFETNGTTKSAKTLNFVLIFLCLAFGYFFRERIASERHLKRALAAQHGKAWPEMYAHAVAAKSSVMASDELATPLDWYAGFAKFYNGDAASAERLFLSATRTNPFHLQTWNDLGTCYERRRAYAEAIECYKRALELNRNYHNTLLNLTAAYFNAGYTDSAYATISRYPRNYNRSQYRNFLLAVLKAKLKLLANDELNEKQRAQLVALSNDDKRLIEAFERAQRSGKKIELICFEMIE